MAGRVSRFAAALALVLWVGGPSAAGDGPAAGPPAPGRDPYSVGWVGAVFGRLKEGGGIAVRSVDPDGPAQKAGLQPGDVVVLCSGRPVDDLYGFLSGLKQLDPGTRVTLDVSRGEQRLKLDVVLGARKVRVALEDASARAADWLAAQQLPGGAWPRTAAQVTEGQTNPSATLTALVLLAFLSAPDSVRARHAAVIERGTAYLLANHSPAGWVGNAEEPVRLQNYTTALALQALLVADAKKHAAAVARMRAYLEQAQLTEANQFTDLDWLYGSWNYYDEIRPYSLRGDVSIVSFVLEGLHAAGLPAASPVWAKARRFLGRCQNLEADPGQRTEVDDGGFFFNPRASKAGEVSLPGNKVKFRSYGSATCDGLRSLLHAGVPKDDPRVAAALAWLRKNWTLRENAGFAQDLPVAYWSGIFYYYYHGLAKALDAWGEETITSGDGKVHYWAREIGDWLSTLQKKEGYWMNANNVMGEDDPLLATGLALLTMDLVIRRMK